MEIIVAIANVYVYSDQRARARGVRKEIIIIITLNQGRRTVECHVVGRVSGTSLTALAVFSFFLQGYTGLQA